MKNKIILGTRKLRALLAYERMTTEHKLEELETGDCCDYKMTSSLANKIDDIQAYIDQLEELENKIKGELLWDG